MSELEKVLHAKANSRHFLQDSHHYRGVDGRTYQTETQPVAPQTTISNDDLYRLRHTQDMSLQELYQMELFLTDGTRNKKLTPKTKDRDRILAEYPIAKDPKTHKFMGDKDMVWDILKEKFPEATSHFENYTACQYAVKYGAIEQIAWKKPESQEIKAWTPDRSENPDKEVTNNKGFTKSGEWVAPSQRANHESAIEIAKNKADVGPSR